MRLSHRLQLTTEMRGADGVTAVTRKRQNNIKFLTFRFLSKSRQKCRDFNIATSFSDRKISVAEP